MTHCRRSLRLCGSKALSGSRADGEGRFPDVMHNKSSFYFILSFIFFNEEWGSRKRAKREFGSPPPGWRVGCVCGVGVCGCGARGCGAAGQLRFFTEMVPFPFQRHCKTAEKGSFPGVFIFPV